MASKTTGAPDELLSIEALQQKHKTPAAVMAGVKIQTGWRAGKYVTDTDYLAAINRFLTGKVGS
ncbi:MAG TPA: hypothetical protein VN626_11105 [Clostridia bacterium]|nr:hypothetical protein [Clostridia bacterium]